MRMTRPETSTDLVIHPPTTLTTPTTPTTRPSRSSPPRAAPPPEAQLLRLPSAASERSRLQRCIQHLAGAFALVEWGNHLGSASRAEAS